MMTYVLRKNNLILPVIFLAFSLIAVSGADEGDPEFTNLVKGSDGRYHWEEVEETTATAVGEAEFKTYCGSCHGPRAVGDGPMAKLLTKKPSNLRQIAKKNGGEFPFWETYRMVDGREAIEGHGGREMPVWGDEFMEQVPTKAGSMATKQAYRVAQKKKAQSEVRERLLQMVLYLQSIQDE